MKGWIESAVVDVIRQKCSVLNQEFNSFPLSFFGCYVKWGPWYHMFMKQWLQVAIVSVAHKMNCQKMYSTMMKILTATSTLGSGINVSTSLKQFIHDFKVTTLSSKVKWGNPFRFGAPCWDIHIHSFIKKLLHLLQRILNQQLFTLGKILSTEWSVAISATTIEIKQSISWTLNQSCKDNWKNV